MPLRQLLDRPLSRLLLPRLLHLLHLCVCCHSPSAAGEDDDCVSSTVSTRQRKVTSALSWRSAATRTSCSTRPSSRSAASSSSTAAAGPSSSLKLRARRERRFWPQFTFYSGHDHSAPSYSNVLDCVYHTPASLPSPRLHARHRRPARTPPHRPHHERTHPVRSPAHCATFYLPALDKLRART